jgi:molybdopterin-guanine dinucleotide biosynthesis protein A
MDGPLPDVAAFILAGGRSTRMGADKAFVALEGRTLLARALDLARSISSDVRIVGDRSKFAPFAPVVEDIFPGCGPLGGIHAALLASQKEFNVILAVDVPFVSFALLQFLITRARNSDATVTLARAGAYWQPLCAVYRRDFSEAAERALRAGHYKIDPLFDEVAVQGISEEELETAGFTPAIFRNLNTPEELAEASAVSGANRNA